MTAIAGARAPGKFLAKMSDGLNTARMN